MLKWLRRLFGENSSIDILDRIIRTDIKETDKIYNSGSMSILLTTYCKDIQSTIRFLKEANQRLSIPDRVIIDKRCREIREVSLFEWYTPNGVYTDPRTLTEELLKESYDFISHYREIDTGCSTGSYNKRTLSDFYDHLVVVIGDIIDYIQEGV